MAFLIKLLILSVKTDIKGKSETNTKRNLKQIIKKILILCKNCFMMRQYALEPLHRLVSLEIEPIVLTLF